MGEEARDGAAKRREHAAHGLGTHAAGFEFDAVKLVEGRVGHDLLLREDVCFLLATPDRSAPLPQPPPILQSRHALFAARLDDLERLALTW
jgi:hypothetical protein